ncbi:MAG TPA: glycosyltransferase family 4 protein [Allocoleopsis sp.]
MHIAWLGKKSPFCGNVTYSREVTNALLDRGHQVSFLHFAEEESESKNWWGSQEVMIPFLYKSQVYTIPTFTSAKVLTDSLKKLKPDIVHASLTLSPLDFLLPEICSELELPLIATFHTPYARKGAKLKTGTQLLAYQLYAPFLINYDNVIIFSDIQKELLVRLGIPENKVTVIPNGVDTDKYSPGFSKFKNQFKGEKLFVYQGRIAIEKNVEALLKAWQKSKIWMEKDCKLIIVGDGPVRATLEPFYGQENGVIWLGFIGDDTQRIDILRGTDVFILPSLVEGLSLSLLEAMSCGIACVATDVGADGEVLSQEAGIIVNPQRVVTELQTLLPLLKEHTGFTKKLGERARKRDLERYTLSSNITQVEQLYEKILQQQKVKLNWRY